MNTILFDRLAKDVSRSGNGRDVTTKRPATGENYQSFKLFTRLLWKEYRQLRPIWMLLAVIIAVISSLPGLNLIPRDPSIAFNLIFSVPALFALVAGIYFFANENEQGTDRWLVQWTVPTLTLFVVKYIAASSGIAFLVCLSVGLASIFELPIAGTVDGRVTWTFWHGAIYFIVACVPSMITYVLTVAASVLTGRVISTVIVAGAMCFAIVRVYVAAGTWSTNRHLIDSAALWTIRVEAGLLFALFCVALVIAPFLLARRLRGISTSSSRATFERPRFLIATSFRGWRARGQMISLLWKEYRQSRLWVIGLVVFSFYVASEFASNYSKMSNSSFGPAPSSMHMFDTFYVSRPVEMLFVFLGSIFMGVAYLSGMFTFMSDQRGRSFRFLTHQGVSAPYLWMLKQAVWLPFVAFWIALLLIVSFNRTISLSYVWAPWGMLTAYAVLQLAMLLIPQTILALTIGLCATVILLYFSLAMTLLDIPLLFVVAIPMPIFLLLSSLALSRSWMEEESGWKSTWTKFGIVAGPLAAIFVVACLFRAFEVPATPAKDLIPAYLSPATPEDIATANAHADLFKRAESFNENEAKTHAHYVNGKREVVYSDELIRDLVEITKRPDGTFSRIAPAVEHEWIELRNERVEFEFLASMLFKAAKDFEKKGEWNNAKEMYLAIFRMIDHAFHRGHVELRSELFLSAKSVWHGIFRWAKQPGISVDEITQVLNQLKSKAVVAPDLPMEWYLADHNPMKGEVRHKSDYLLGPGYFLMPWETERSRRVEDYIHASILKGVMEFKNRPPRTMNDYGGIATGYERWERWRLNSNTISSHYWYDRFIEWEDLARRNLAALAAVAWYKEHGWLPMDLKLATKQYLGEVPRLLEWSEPCGIWTSKGRFAIVPERYSEVFRQAHPVDEADKPALHPEDSFTLDPNTD